MLTNHPVRYVCLGHHTFSTFYILAPFITFNFGAKGTIDLIVVW